MQMQLTIKARLLGLTISGLVFVAGVSVTGYWGITSVHQTTVQVAATGSAIRNHIEAGVYNDLTRTDTSAVFTEKGDEQQNKAEEFAQHGKLLQERLAKARKTIEQSVRNCGQLADQRNHSQSQHRSRTARPLLAALQRSPGKD
jgi:hypothetical protein